MKEASKGSKRAKVAEVKGTRLCYHVDLELILCDEKLVEVLREGVTNKKRSG